MHIFISYWIWADMVFMYIFCNWNSKASLCHCMDTDVCVIGIDHKVFSRIFTNMHENGTLPNTHIHLNVSIYLNMMIKLKTYCKQLNVVPLWVCEDFLVNLVFHRLIYPNKGYTLKDDVLLYAESAIPLVRDCAAPLQFCEWVNASHCICHIYTVYGWNCWYPWWYQKSPKLSLAQWLYTIHLLQWIRNFSIDFQLMCSVVW